jgi:hypothetical protein
MTSGSHLATAHILGWSTVGSSGGIGRQSCLPGKEERALARFLQAPPEASGEMRSSAGEDPRHRNATSAAAAAGECSSRMR